MEKKVSLEAGEKKKKKSKELKSLKFPKNLPELLCSLINYINCYSYILL